MKAVCVCGDIHLPYIPKWYWPIKGFSEKPRLDRYFDGKTTFTSFQSLGKGLLSLNRLIQSSIENGGKYAFALSGPFLNQCYWAPKVRNSFLKLQESGQVEFLGSCHFHSLSALYPDLSWFQEEVKLQTFLLQRFIGEIPKIFTNTELLLSERVEDSLIELGFKGIIGEGSKNLLNGSAPSHIYKNRLPTLLRHINLSEDLEIRFSERSWKGYPLIPEKFADWISNMEGDLVTLYFNYATLCLHHKKKSQIATFIKELPLELEKRELEMLTPSEAIVRFSPKKLSTLQTEQTIRYGMHNVLGNRAQQLYFRELGRAGEDLRKIRELPNYEAFKRIFGYLQQSDLLFAMGTKNNSREGYEKALNYYSILSDFRRALLEERK